MTTTALRSCKPWVCSMRVRVYVYICAATLILSGWPIRSPIIRYATYTRGKGSAKEERPFNHHHLSTLLHSHKELLDLGRCCMCSSSRLEVSHPIWLRTEHPFSFTQLRGNHPLAKRQIKLCGFHRHWLCYQCIVKLTTCIIIIILCRWMLQNVCICVCIMYMKED